MIQNNGYAQVDTNLTPKIKNGGLLLGRCLIFQGELESRHHIYTQGP
jgi:hypothetical protein